MSSNYKKNRIECLANSAALHKNSLHLIFSTSSIVNNSRMNIEFGKNARKGSVYFPCANESNWKIVFYIFHLNKISNFNRKNPLDFVLISLISIVCTANDKLTYHTVSNVHAIMPQWQTAWQHSYLYAISMNGAAQKFNFIFTARRVVSLSWASWRLIFDTFFWYIFTLNCSSHCPIHSWTKMKTASSVCPLFASHFTILPCDAFSIHR